ncbi:MAG: hypothetical protein ONB23_10510 [candidate division KSB1 bacterium]|nr:hypothetical protein [candidate division KSB1 bacterium]
MQEELAGTGHPPEASIARYLRLSWQLFWRDAPMWVLLTIIYAAVLGVVSTTAIGPPILWGPLEVGWYAVILKRVRGQSLDLDEFARGFHRFVPAFLAGVAVQAFALVGLALLVIPLFVVLALYLFVWPVLVDEDLDFWSAMERSRRATQPLWIEWTLFSFLIVLVNFLGILFCLVGLLVSLPWTKIAVALAYEEQVRGVRLSEPICVKTG